MVAAAVIGAAAIGAVGSAAASSSAAGAQKSAANTAANTQMDMYNQTVARNQPYVDAGTTALGQISSGTQPGGQFDQSFNLNDFQQDPGYQFRLDQGDRALNASAASKGMSLSGAALKGLDAYNSGQASQQYQQAYQNWNTDLSNRFNRLSSIAGLGQASANGTAAAGAGAANQISSAQIGAGNATAAGYVGAANAVNSGASSIGNYYANQSYLNQINNQNASSYKTPAPQVTYTNGNGEYTNG